MISSFNIKIRINNSLLENVYVIIFVSISTFLAKFLLFKSFGLYEDDYWSIAPGFTLKLPDLFHHILSCIINWPQGRPLNHFMPQTLGYISSNLGGMDILYIISSLWLSLNVYLVYCISRHWLNTSSSLICSLTYLLFPSDMTRELPHAVAHVQGAMTYTLLSWYLWLKPTRIHWLAYPISALSLVSYELTFLPFIAAPFFGHGLVYKSKNTKWISHFIACFTIIGIIAIIRLLLKDARAITLFVSPFEMVKRSLFSTLIGPFTDLRAFIFAMNRIRETSIQYTIPCVIFIIFGVFIISLKTNISAPKPFSYLKRILIASIICWGASYLLTLVNYPPTQIVGRMTSTHVAAALPFSILMGVIYEYLIAKSSIIKTLTIATYCLILTCLFSYSILVQKGFVNSAQSQKDFWQQVLKLAPDAEKGTSIIIVGTPAPDKPPHFILTNSWADFYACRAMYGQSSDFDDSDSVQFGHLGINPELWDFKVENSEIVMWRPKFWTTDYAHIIPSKLILIESKFGHLTRVQKLSLSFIDHSGNPINLNLYSTRPIPTYQFKARAPSTLFKAMWSRSS